jgi:hypothetical protein
MNAPLTELPTDAEVVKARVVRNVESQHLGHRDCMNIWRWAVADCLALARRYAEMAEIGASVEDDIALRHGVANFLAAARAAQDIYKNDRPRQPWEKPSAKNEEAR